MPATKWQKGQSGNPAGRKPGIPNKLTRSGRLIAKKLVDDPEYRKALRERLRTGDAGGIETHLWCLAYGKPKSTVELQGVVPEGDTVNIAVLVENLSGPEQRVLLRAIQAMR